MYRTTVNYRESTGCVDLIGNSVLQAINLIPSLFFIIHYYVYGDEEMRRWTEEDNSKKNDTEVASALVFVHRVGTIWYPSVSVF